MGQMLEIVLKYWWQSASHSHSNPKRRVVFTSHSTILVNVKLKTVIATIYWLSDSL